MALTQPRTLKQRVIHAGSWAVGGHVVQQAIRLGGNLLLTRLLVPEAFGLMAIVYVLMIGFALFSDIGIGSNIVQHPRGEDPAFLNTAWTVQVMRGIAIWLLALLAALALPLASDLGWVKAGTVYADPLLPWVIAVFSLTAVISGFDSTNIAVARRKMQVRLLTQIEVASQVVALVVMAALAWWTRSIWALVVGGLVAAAVRCALSHAVLAGARNAIALDKSALHELLNFGKWIFVSSISGFLVINGDRLMLGGLVDAQTLGMYAIAFLLANSLSLILGTLLGNVFFPALSQIARERPHDLAATLDKFQRLADAFLLTASGFLIMAGSSIVALLYDARYQAAGPMLSLLAVGCIGLRYQVVEQCYLAMGKPQITAATNAFRMLVLYVGLPVAFYTHQFAGAMIAIVVSQYSGWPMALYFKFKHGLMTLKGESFAVPALLAGLALGALFQSLAPTRMALRSLF